MSLEELVNHTYLDRIKVNRESADNEQKVRLSTFDVVGPRVN
jgi:hypothetical protein